MRKMRQVLLKIILLEIIMFFAVSLLCVLYDVDKFIAGIYVMLNYLCLADLYDRVTKE